MRLNERGDLVDSVILYPLLGWKYDGVDDHPVQCLKCGKLKYKDLK